MMEEERNGLRKIRLPLMEEGAISQGKQQQSSSSEQKEKLGPGSYNPKELNDANNSISKKQILP